MGAVYLDLVEFRRASVMPSSDVDLLEETEPGFLAERAELWTGWIKARLAKRYVTDFAAGTVPRPIRGWMVALLTVDAYKRRGWNPSSAQDADIAKDAETAKAEILEAANSKDGLFELPLLEGSSSSGVSRGGPRSYSEVSPYTWTDRQREAVTRGDG